MKKILFIHHAADWGGGSINLIENINGLQKDKFCVIVLLLKDSVVTKKLHENNINYLIAKSFFYRKIYKYFTHHEANYLKWYQVLLFINRSFLWFLSKY
jgi:hypothetical protein